MSAIIFWFAIFFVSLLLLLKASDLFIEAAEKIGIYFKLPTFIIGFTIVAFGTSLPELSSAIIAVLEGSSEIVMGNVIGANIANFFLILGMVAVVGRNLLLNNKMLGIDIPLLVGSVFLLGAAAWDGEITRGESFINLMLFAMYIFYAVSSRKAKKIHWRRRSIVEFWKQEAKIKNIKKILPFKNFAILGFSLVLIFAGAKLLIESIQYLALNFDVGQEVIAGTVLSIGTTLPEFMVSISAVRKKKPEIVMGNIVGSNIFNILGVVGISGMLGAITVPESILTFALPVLVAAVILFFFIVWDKKITRWEGGILLILYIFYVGKLFKWF